MYKFVDTTEVSEVAFLPSEALQLNGEYIENLIPGYRTLSVSGREALSAEIDTYETGIRDGATIKSKRYPERIIIVKYQLVAEDAAAFRAAYNKLGGILAVEDAELIFNDETDKYFIGTPCAIGEVEPGRNAVIGEFEILCADPFKYSVEEYEAEAVFLNDGLSKQLTVDYNGTYKSYPKFEVEFYKENEAVGETVNTLTDNGDCGFVAFFNEREKIIQLGNVEETDGEEVPVSQCLVNQSFKTADSWGSAARSLWAVNSGVLLEDNTVEVGTIGYNSANKYLTAANYGTSTQRWQGPTISRVIPADATGVVGATNWRLSFKTRVSMGNTTNSTKEQGGIQAFISDANDNIIAGVFIYKSYTGNKGFVRTVLNNEFVDRWSCDMTYKNGHFRTNGSNNVEIQKSGQKFQFKIGGVRATYNFSDLADTVATKITFLFFRTHNYPAITYNGLYNVSFTKDNCDTFNDIPNIFIANDVLNANCEDAEIYLNGRLAPELGALGNDWEEFHLQPGSNQIGVSYSDWLTPEYAPTVKMKYREVFL